jgi:predicted phosphodiesterase
MLALISDIHSNLEALTAVLEDIDQRKVSEIICLGDVVGYGPDPVPVVDLVMSRAKLCIKGNHDEALVHGAVMFNPPAKHALDWTRDQLKPGYFSGVQVRRRWDWLVNLPLRHEAGQDLFTHGSPRDPTTEYLLTTEVSFGPSDKYEEVFASFNRLLFVGHTHLPCVITDGYEAKVPSEYEGEKFVHSGKGKAIVNVGSVGQPRDNDARACYVLFDPETGTVEWRRVAYAHEKTAAKVRERGLNERLALRLAVGN